MVDTDHQPDLENLSAWQAALARQAEDLRSDIRTKQADLAKVEERLALVTKLIDVEVRTNGAAAEPAGEVKAKASQSSGKALPRVTAASGLEQAVEDILRAAGTPMHISEIRAVLIEQQVPIPGRGDEANIIVRISPLEDRFTRTARGTYGLAEWGLPALANKKRARGRKAAR